MCSGWLTILAVREVSPHQPSLLSMPMSPGIEDGVQFWARIWNRHFLTLESES